MTTDIAHNLATIHARINNACLRFSRPATSVQLLAVSKTKPADMLRLAYNEGQCDFGENYLQEALDKMANLSDCTITWHFIGSIQSNKTKPIAEHFDWVHGVDRLKIAQRLSDARPAHLPPLNICLQVNISDESSKSGTDLESICELAQQAHKLPRLKLRGLMALPAAASDFEQQRASFALLKQLFDTLNHSGLELDTLSMGMSNDLEAAIAEGATIVRIGSAIFGERS